MERGFRAGLAYEAGYEPRKAPDQGFRDYYEILQVSPNADPEMIHRLFRLLARRYHPDNADTGDEQAFRAIADAYKVLSDPEKRAAYDANLHAYRQTRWRIFDQRQADGSKLAENAKRRGTLELLYTARQNLPTQPTLNLREMEDLLGSPREHLEFTLWYLKENALVIRTDNARYSITAKGVDLAEQYEHERPSSDRLLLSAQQPTDLAA